MSEYLSKEEVKQWRSSLEKITLEDFAARLGKKIEESKPTNDLVDIVLKGKPVVSSNNEWRQTRAERLSSIAENAYSLERKIAPSAYTISKLVEEERKQKTDKAEAVKAEATKVEVSLIAETEVVKPVKNTKITEKVVKTEKTKKTEMKTEIDKAVEIKETKKSIPTLREEVQFVFKKALTDREQKVFDHFAQNQGQIVYAKDLAILLELPRDYVYKYIKNLRAKIDGDKLQNADKGGFVLSM